MLDPREASHSSAPCPATPEQEEGPYYRQLSLERDEITEGRPGVPLELQLTVTDIDCAPMQGNAVDIWHCDALGTYSWYAAAGEAEEHGGFEPAPGNPIPGCEGAGLARGTFLRGWQTTDSHGACRFRTIYPGWYPGRAVHIHVKVHHRDGVLTTQLYFPDELSDSLHQLDPYLRRPRRDTTNADDSIFREVDQPLVLAPHAVDGGYQASGTLSVG